jgi:hypothetical protein
MVRFVIRFSLVLFLSQFALAQTSPSNGIQPWSTQIEDAVSSVDLATGNIFVSIPVRSKAGKIPFSFNLTMNSYVYTGQCYPPSGGIATTQWQVSPGPELVFNVPTAPAANCAVATSKDFKTSTAFGVGAGYTTDNSYIWKCDGTSYSLGYASGFYVTDPTGATHPVVDGDIPEIQLGGAIPPCYTGTSWAVTTSDGSGYTLAVSQTPTQAASDLYSWTIYDRSGNQTSSVPNQPYPHILVQDPDGAMISVSSSEVYTDTLGATALQDTSGSGSGAPQTFLYTDAAGNTQTVQVNYSSYTAQTAFGTCQKSIPGDVAAVSIYLPSSITTPTGNFTFSYETTPGDTHTHRTM